MLHRIATPADIPALLELVESAYRGERSKAGWTSEADLLGGQRVDAEMLAAIIADPVQRILLIDNDGKLAGSVTVEQRVSSGYIGMVSVPPTQQGKGTGRALLALAEKHLSAVWQLPAARLSVIAQRAELIAWYARRGYAPTGETAPFPYGDARYGLPRRDDLSFVILEKKLP